MVVRLLTLKYFFQIHISYVINSLKPSFISTIIPANNEDCLAQKKKRNNNNVKTIVQMSKKLNTI